MKVNRLKLEDLFEDHTFDEYLTYHSKPNSWADSVMIFCVLAAFQIKISIESQRYQKAIVYLEESDIDQILYLFHENENHFKLKNDGPIELKN